MIKDTEIKEFRSDDPSSFLSNPDQRRKIDMVKTEEIKKPKKRVVEPIEIPEIISVPRLDQARLIHGKKTVGMVSNKNLLPESYNTGPVTEGLSQRFTQEKLYEGKILKQIDQQMTNERKSNQTTNKGGDQ